MMKIFINETTKDVLEGIYHVNFLILPADLDIS